MYGVKRLLLACTVCAGMAWGHVNSPDVYFQGKAGPYPLLVAIRPPEVIPGIAKIEVRALGPGVRAIELTPTPMTGEGSKHPPTADAAQQSQGDPQYFEGSSWLMGFGSWEIHIHASGAAGTGDMVVPVPALATKIKPMQKEVSYLLFGMMVFLTAGMVAIVGASVHEAQLEPGAATQPWNRKALIAMGVAAVLLPFALWRGSVWWGEDAALHAQRLYKPLGLSATLAGPDRLEMRIKDPGWLVLRRMDDLVPDHGHLMHLFAVRWPEMDRMYHLHPDETAPGYFSILLPPGEAGTYRLYGDIVHENGLAETATGEIRLPALTEDQGKPLAMDDAEGEAAPVSHASEAESFDLGDGYHMVWKRDKTKAIRAKELMLFAFEITDPRGEPVMDLEPYMGMAGHAEVIRTDGNVFAHVHPSGSVSMASEAVASQAGMMAMHEANSGPIVSFPYGVPTPGKYRMFVQMKRAGQVQASSFDFDAQ